MQDISVIVPFFNEAGRVDRVVNELLSWDVFEKVIAVDDGSSDGGADTLPLDERLKVVRLSTNNGKGAAVLRGLNEVKSRYVMLFDADVREVVRDEYIMPIEKWMKAGGGMLLYRRVETVLSSRLLGFDLWLTGERAMEASVLRKLLHQTQSKGYELEHDINAYFIENRLPIYWTPVKTKNTFKVYKRSIYDALVAEWKMFWQVVRRGRWREYARLLIWSDVEKMKLEY